MLKKLQFSLFLISFCQGILNSSWLSWYLVLKIACLHVSFTAYENFYKLSKNVLSSHLVFYFPIIRSIRNQISNNQTYIHLYTDLIIHKYICDRSLSGDPFHIANLFQMPRAYSSVTQHTFPTKSQLDSPSVCPYLI